ncbi:MAG: ABC transporter permease [Bacilli bacterium]
MFSLFYASILSIFIGLFISSVSKTSQSAQIIGMMFFFINMFLAGLLLPIGAINSVEPLRIISYFTPYRYVSGLSTTAWATNYGDIFNPNFLQPIAKAELKFEVYDN